MSRSRDDTGKMASRHRSTHTESLPSDGLPPLREVIRAHGLRAKKSLGQNFILDLNLTRAIARAAGPLTGVTVLEIGPGPGGLTRALLLEGAAHVIAVEHDRRCLAALDEIAQRYPKQLTIIEQDALRADWPALVATAESEVQIVANLPFNIATVLLIDWLAATPWPPWFTRMTLMFQNEVAERIVAAPATKAYGRLAVICQWRSQPKVVIKVPSQAFTPAPKVACAVVDFVPRPAPTPPCDVVLLGKITAAAFGQRRKMLRSSLKAVTPLPEALLNAAGVSGDLRGEQLDVAAFAKLAQALAAGG